ncbi:MAG: hypothetical protein ABI068_15420 [Ktedonobacterales bacterium]
MKKLRSRRVVFTALSLALVAVLATSILFVRSLTSHADASTSPGMTLQTVHSAGTGSFSSNDTGALTGDTLNQVVPKDNDRDQHTNAVYANAPTTNPNPSGNPVTSGSASGFQGLDHFDTRTRDGGNAFSLEPPDQGLCVGNGYVIEAVNDVMVVFDKSGNRLTVPTSMNTFFGLPVAINRTTGARGPFLSDPKCLYDAATGRFFLTVLEEDAAPSVRANTLIAVSKTGDARGDWYLYSIDATDDGQNGTPANPGCPCFGDQPLIGANGDGFFITTNEFGAGFNGAQVYAMPKAALTTGSLPKVVHINAGSIPTPDAGGIWYSIQPATSPSSGGQGQIKKTEFFMSALQFGPAPLDNRIAVWSLENTSALVSGNPTAVKLSHTVISSETYGGTSFAVSQKAGNTPLGHRLTAITGHPNPENHLNANDDRMNQVVYANGMLWSGLNTVVNTSGSQYGVAYFIVSPQLHGHNLSATMVKQGYVAVAGNNTLFPSIGVNAAGKGAIAFTVSGPDYYPSAGYALIDATNGAGDVHISGAGVGPADGFTGYPDEGGNGVERWGDYSAAVADADGSIWMANEYIAQTCTDAQYNADSTCGGTRTSLANWSTFIANVKP